MEDGPGMSHCQVTFKQTLESDKGVSNEDFGRAFQTEGITYRKALNMPGIYKK